MTIPESFKNPVSVTEAIRQVIYAMILFEVVHWSEAQTIGFLSAVSAVIAMFLRGSTVSTASVEKKVDERVAHREMAGTTGTGTGMAQPETRTGTGTPGL